MSTTTSTAVDDPAADTAATVDDGIGRTRAPHGCTQQIESAMREIIATATQ